MPNQIVTRFAPSPTGYLHIGGARTALFNWLYARGAKAEGKGKFLLRIEDTDRARHNEAAVAAILDGLSWLGLDWDGDPVSQFSQQQRHREIAEHLLATGRAYRCWLEGDELNDARQQARDRGTRFESPWREIKNNFPDHPFAIRLKAPRTGETKIEDMVQGDVTFPASALDDMVLLRSDGTPTYMLAVVVDDYDMGITHVIRGDDHLVNGARQTQLYQALDWPLPRFAHIPLIHGADGAKLSKRHGALGVEHYRDAGILPEALCNYLLRLGWSHGDDEKISTEQALSWFDISQINKGASRLDLDKLNHLNALYLHELNPDDFLARAEQHLPEFFNTLDATKKAALTRAAPFIQARCKSLSDLPEETAFLTLTRPLAITGKAAKPLRKDGAIDRIKTAHDWLLNVPDWTSEGLDAALQALTAHLQIGFGQIGPPLRAALTAGHRAPQLAETLYALGREESLGRLCDVLANGLMAD